MGTRALEITSFNFILKVQQPEPDELSNELVFDHRSGSLEDNL